MKNKKNQSQTYDFICFSDLAYEFDDGERKKIESKIRKRLKYHGLGKFDPDRVGILRKLKDQLREEFRDYKIQNIIEEPPVLIAIRKISISKVFFGNTEPDFRKLRQTKWRISFTLRYTYTI